MLVDLAKYFVEHHPLWLAMFCLTYVARGWFARPDKNGHH